MQYIPSNAKTTVPHHIANRLPLKPAFYDRGEESELASVLRARFHHDKIVRIRALPLHQVMPMEEDIADDQKYTGWTLVTAWAGVAAGTWAIVIGGVMIARALLP